MTDEKPDYLSPKEMQQWALQEMADSAKAHELRTKGAMEIAGAYALGELTAEQAHERFIQHNDRWPEALPGTHVFKKSTDEQLLADIDRARRESQMGFMERVSKKSDRPNSR